MYAPVALRQVLCAPQNHASDLLLQAYGRIINRNERVAVGIGNLVVALSMLAFALQPRCGVGVVI
jgi:hypothetical protein